MADIINMQELADAKLDAQSLERFINGGADEEVLTRLSQQYPTIKKLLLEFQKYNGRAYKTYALMDADKANIPAKSKVTITNDETASNNGDWQWDGVAFTKSAYDPLTQAKADANAAEAKAKQAAENNDINLLVAVQNIVKLVNHLSNDSDILQTLVNRLSTDSDILQTADTNLLVAVQSLAKRIFNVQETIGSDEDHLKNLYAAQLLAQELYKLDNFDPKDLDTGTIDTAKNKVYANILDFPYPTSLIKINFETISNLPTAKGTVISGQATITVDSTSIKSFSTLEVQGSSSQYFPKKNWTIALFKDSDFEDAVELKIGNVPTHDEWVFKANYVDASHVRNILSNRLWQSIVDSRKGYPKLEIDRVYVGKTGTSAIYSNAIGRVEAYPCVFNVNNEFYGIGSFNIGKKYFNYNLDRSNSKNIQIDWGSRQADITKLSVNYTNTAIFELKSPKKITDDTVTYLQEWDAFASSTQADFTANANNHLLEINVVDYWLFSDLLYNYDGLGKNFQFVSQGDGIFLFMPYDLDSVFGSNYSGDGTISATGVLRKDDLPSGTKNFWDKVKVTYASQLKTRYAELRKNGVFTVDNIYELSMELLNKYPKKVVIAEQEKWTAISSLSYSNLPQIMSWTAQRLAYLDTQYSYTA